MHFTMPRNPYHYNDTVVKLPGHIVAMNRLEWYFAIGISLHGSVLHCNVTVTTWRRENTRGLSAAL